MGRHDVLEASRGFKTCPGVSKGGELPQVHWRVFDSAPAAVA